MLLFVPSLPHPPSPWRRTDTGLASPTFSPRPLPALLVTQSACSTSIACGRRAFSSYSSPSSLPLLPPRPSETKSHRVDRLCSRPIRGGASRQGGRGERQVVHRCFVVFSRVGRQPSVAVFPWARPSLPSLEYLYNAVRRVGPTILSTSPFTSSTGNDKSLQLLIF